jgi:hypothetical protein
MRFRISDLGRHRAYGMGHGDGRQKTEDSSSKWLTVVLVVSGQ